MLMHHSYPQIIRIVGAVYFYLVSLYIDISSIGMVKTEEDAHQGRFPRSVFSQNRMYLSLFNAQAYIIVCHDSGKFLADTSHFNHIIRMGQFELLKK